MALYPLPNSFDVALAEYALGLIGSDDLPRVAVCALAVGVESPFLAALAGENSRADRRELRELFDRGMTEAGIALPAKSHAAATVLEQTIRQVGTNEVSAEVAMARLIVVFDALAASAGAPDAGALLRPDMMALRDCVHWYRYRDTDTDEFRSEAFATVRTICERIIDAQ